MDWFEIKNWLELSTGLDRNSLHIYSGVAVHLGVAFVLRRSLASLVPWAIVLVAAFANEYYDYATLPESPNGEKIYYDEAVRDIWNTLLLPSIFLIIARFWPTWLTGRLRNNGEAERLESANPPI